MTPITGAPEFFNEDYYIGKERKVMIEGVELKMIHTIDSLNTVRNGTDIDAKDA
jgi:hypothetical protein